MPLLKSLNSAYLYSTCILYRELQVRVHVESVDSAQSGSGALGVRPSSAGCIRVQVLISYQVIRASWWPSYDVRYDSNKHSFKVSSILLFFNPLLSCIHFPNRAKSIASFSFEQSLVPFFFFDNPFFLMKTSPYFRFR